MMRVIKKYPNRRLYDTEWSQYVTMTDLRQLVIDNVDFCVKDMKTKEDVTRNVLLQIIAEQEQGQDPFFSISALSQIIRFYEDSMQSVAGDFVQKSLDLFVTQQKKMQTSMTKNPIAAMSQIVESNLKIWRNVQLNFFKTANLNRKKK